MVRRFGEVVGGSVVSALSSGYQTRLLVLLKFVVGGLDIFFSFSQV